jgi:hypothetical protein
MLQYKSKEKNKMSKLATQLIIFKFEPSPLQVFKYMLQESTSWKFTNNITLYIYVCTYMCVCICNTDFSAAWQFIDRITT